MKTFVLMLSAVFALTACQTTKPGADAGIEVRPITQMSGLEPAQKFDVNARLKAAADLYAKAKFLGSYTAYKTLLLRMDTKHTSRGEALLGLADNALALVWRDGKYADQARKIYEKISGDDLFTQTQIDRAETGLLLLALASNEQDAAKQNVEHKLKTSPDDPRLWNALGRLHDQNSNWLDALDAYVQALVAAKSGGFSTASAHNNMGMSLLMQGRKKEALTKFKQAVKTNPNMPVYDNNLRLAQTLSGQTKQALQGVGDIRAAQIYNDAGVIAQAQGNHSKAAKFYKTAIEKSPIYVKLAEENLAAMAMKTAVKALP